MPLSYDNLLTPFASPALGRINPTALGEAGQALSDSVRQDQLRQDRLAEQQRRYELDKAGEEGKNRYYDAQAATHRMQVEEAKNSATNKRANALFDAFRKTKTPSERSLIRDELKRIGYSVEEGDTELPGQAGGPQASPSSTGGVSAAALSATIDPSQSAMGHIGEPGGIASGATAGESGVPEMGVLPSAAPAMPKMSRGGRFTIKDPTGIQVASYDEPMERMKSQLSIRGALGSMGLAATTDREKAATAAATEAGANMLDLGVDPNNAVKHAVDIYGHVLNTGEFKKTLPPGAGGGGPGGPSKTDIKILGMDREQADKIIRRTAGNYDMKATSTAVAAARQALRDLQSGEGMPDLDAFKRYLLQMSGKVVTDKEMDQFVNSTGKFNGIEQKIAQWTNEGRFPEEFKRQLGQMFQTFIENAERARKEMGDNARHQAALEGLSPDGQAVVSDFFTGDTSSTPQSAPLGARGKKPAATPAPAGAHAPGYDDYLKGL